MVERTGPAAVGTWTSLVLVALGAAAGVQAAPADATLDALVAEALANNPDVLAATADASAAGERPAQARSLADPTVSVQYTNDAWRPTLGEREMTTLGFMVSQTLPWPGKRVLRGALATQDAVLARERVARVKLTLVAAVKRAYWGLALARETRALLDEQANVWREAEGVARARYTVGQGAQQDVLRAQLEITRFEQRRVEQQAALAVRTAELNRLLGRPADSEAPPTAALLLDDRPLDPQSAIAAAEARSPELRTARAEGERDAIAVRLARKEFQPDVTVQSAYMNRGGLDPMWQAGVGVNLPVFRGRRRAALAEAEAQGRAAAGRLDAVRAQLGYRTRERLAQLSAARSLSRLYTEGLLPQARLVYDSSIASYRAGRVPFLTVLEALSSLFSERAGHLALLAAHEAILASLEEASLEATSELPASGGSMSAGFAASVTTPSAETTTSGGPAAPAAAGMSMGR